MKFAFAIVGTVAASRDIVEDDAALLSKIKLMEQDSKTMLRASANSLSDLTQAQDPRRASELLQEFAMTTIEAGTGIDAETKKQLVTIRDLLTNETYISLEQAHRHDQDLLAKHAAAINLCGQKHLAHLQQDIEGQEVQLVRDTEEAMYRCRGMPDHEISELELLEEGAEVENGKKVDCTSDEATWRDCAVDDFGNYDPKQDPEGRWALKAVRATPSPEQVGDMSRFWSNWSGIGLEKYKSKDFKSCKTAQTEMLNSCDALDDFIRGLPKPNCQPPIGTTEMEVPTCDGKVVGVDSDLKDWFVNMKDNAIFYQGTWKKLKDACDKARVYYKEVCDDECARKQRQFETAFCAFRQGLHATCREYQGCHVLNEDQYKDLIKKVMYNADSRKIDWKAIHKIECYINVLISNDNNTVRAKDLLNCEAGNLNTIETILTGFNETNYLSLIVPEINVSCWDLDVPSYIDFKECDMSSVQQFPCTEKWLDRYNGLVAPAECNECAPIPDDFQYHADQDYNASVVRNDFGGGWYFVNEMGRSKKDQDDLTELAPGGYHLPSYVTGKLRWNEVLVERVSANWCDSWGSQSAYWVEEGGASMCVQSDNEHVYCMNNGHGGHSWRQQPASHFTVNCGGEKQPKCDCWPKNKENVCWAYQRKDAKGATLDNKPAPRHIRLLSLKKDGSVVKISFQGEEKKGILKVGNYNAFVQDAEGCRAVSPVKYRVYVRCLGCSTEDDEFHTKDGAQFNSVMYNPHQSGSVAYEEFTYEAWFKSPLAGKLPREIFGGVNTGLTLAHVSAVKCLHDAGKNAHNRKESGYQLHAGSTDQWGALCFEPNTWYHVAVTRNQKGNVSVFANGREITAKGHRLDGKNTVSTLANSVGGGFADGGQLMNVRIWDHARLRNQIYQDAFATKIASMSDVKGLDHWWPLTKDLKDVITGVPLVGADVRYTPIWCTDLEASGMRGC